MRALLERLRKAEDDLADRLFGRAASGEVHAAVARISQPMRALQAERRDLTEAGRK